MKKFLIFALLLMALSLAFFGCGHSDGWIPEPEKPKVDLSNFEETIFELPGKISPGFDTGEKNSGLFKFTGDDYTKIKNANPGSQLAVSYKASVDYAVAEIGWTEANAGPVISAEGKNRKQTAYIDIEFLIFGDDNFTIHIFNDADLLEVSLMAAPDDYEVVPNPNAVAGGIPIFVPFGNKPQGKGDMSKDDLYNKVLATANAGKKLVFYFDEEETYTGDPIKAGSKKGPDWKVDDVPQIATGGGDTAGWSAFEDGNKVTILISRIIEVMSVSGVTKFDINLNPGLTKGLVYIQIEP